MSGSHFFLIALLLSMSGLAQLTSAQEPDWVRQRPHDEGVLYGIGQSADEENASALSAAQATAEIVTQIMQSIANERVSESEQTTTSKDGEAQRDLTRRFHQRTQVSAAAEALPGAEIIAQERREGMTYTLVRLDKQDFLSRSKALFEHMDQQLQDLSEAPDPLTGAHLQQLRGVHDMARQRSELQQLMIALGAEELPPSPLPLATISERLGYLQQGASIQLQGGDKAPAVRDAILDVIDLLSLREQEEAVFTLRLRERSRSYQSGNWYRAEITSAITVVNNTSGAVLGSLEHKAMDSSTIDEEGALTLAREALIKEMGEKLQQRLLPLLAGQGRR